MAGLGIGDLAQSLQMRRLNAQLKSELSRLGTESTTGKIADIGKAVAGDHRGVVALNRSLATLDVYKTTTAEATLLSDTMQTSIGVMQEALTKQGSAALLSTQGDVVMIAATSTDARETFASVVSALNVQVGGRAVFSGVDTASPLPSPEDLMSALTTAIGTPLSASDAATAISAWFASPTGYAAAYSGSATTLAPFRLNAGETTELAVTALDPGIRTALEGLAMASLVAEGYFGSNRDQQALLMQYAGEKMVGAGNGMAELAARVGTVQGHIADAVTRNSAETAALKTALVSLVESDSYDSATLLKATEAQQNTLYAVTARLSALSLTDFLR